METRREDGRAGDAVVFAGANDPIATLERDLERLFDDHVLAGTGRRDGRLLFDEPLGVPIVTMFTSGSASIALRSW